MFDIEAAFDEISALDAPERVESHPRFMQNLGYLPDLPPDECVLAELGLLDSMPISVANDQSGL
jgi:hypothetical protein